MARKPKSGTDVADAAPESETGGRDLMAMVDATDPRATVADEPTLAPDPVIAPAPAAEPRRTSGAGAFAGMVLGGALVFAGGFGVARWMPDLLPVGTAAVDTAAIEARLADLEMRLTALPVPDATLSDRVAALESTAPPDTAALGQRLDGLDARLTALAEMPAAADGADLAELRAQIAALQAGGPASAQASALADEAEQRLVDVRAAADALRAETEAALADTRRSAALTRLSAALESGAPYAAALADLGGDVPPVLADAATSGLPTLATLQAAFPEAARQGLQAAVQADMGAGWAERVGNFLRVQSGARSLEPREGDDPDAILSRAEAALGAGDIEAALAAVATLPAPAQAAMAAWTASATQRLTAAQAIAALAAQG